MTKAKCYRAINAWSKRPAHPRLRWLLKEILHILLTFAVGVAISVIYHEFITNKAVRSAAERICTVYGTDAEECKANIDTVLNLSDDAVENNINITGVEK